MAAGVSIVICCYNSASRLPETLRHIAAQRVDAHLPWEVVVVNNRSTDHTAEAAGHLWAGLAGTAPLRVVEEPNPGLSHARQKGIEAARYDYVILCDDDNWLHPGYVQLAHDLLRANARAGILGGQSEAVCEGTAPGWFEQLKAAYAVGRQYGHAQNKPVEVVWGAGMVLRKEVWKQLQAAGFVHKLSDRKGKQLLSGNDDEMCLAFRLAGYQVLYDDRLFLRHFIPAGRLTPDYVRRVMVATAYSALALEPYRLVLDAGNTPENHPKNRWLGKAFATGRELLGGLRDYVWSRRNNNLTYCIWYEKKARLGQLYMTQGRVFNANLQYVSQLKHNLNHAQRTA